MQLNTLPVTLCAMTLVIHHIPYAVETFAKLIVAGTMRYAELKPNLSNSLFPPASIHTQGPMSGSIDRKAGMNVSRRRTKSETSLNKDLKETSSVDEFLDDDIDDRDMVEAGRDFW